MRKLAFLFLTVANIYHEKTWKNFFKNHEHQYTLYVHSKYPLSYTSFFKPYELPVKIPTQWETTMRAQLELLKYALKDPDNYKFIFLSESTLPLCLFDQVYTELIKHPYSEFNYIHNPHIYEKSRNLYPLPVQEQYKNSQWVILNRKHAQLMTQDNYYIRIIDNCFADNEHYPSTFLAAHDLLNEVIKKDRTFVYWPSRHAPHPYTFSSITTAFARNLLRNALENNYLFARKFALACDITSFKELMRTCKSSLQ